MKQILLLLSFFTISSSAMFLRAPISSCARPCVPRISSINSTRAQTFTAARNHLVARSYVKMTRDHYQAIASELAKPCHPKEMIEILKSHYKDAEDLDHLLKISIQETQKFETACNQLGSFNFWQRREAQKNKLYAEKNQRIIKSSLGEAKRTSAPPTTSLANTSPDNSVMIPFTPDL